jgi:transposase InsO family protein
LSSSLNKAGTLEAKLFKSSMAAAALVLSATALAQIEGNAHPDSARPRYRREPVASPKQKWVADFTYIWTAEGWLFVAAVMDL